MKTIRLHSINHENTIHPSELLLPLNGLTNLINLLERIDDTYSEYILKRNQRNEEPDFARFIEIHLNYRNYHINSNRENDSVMIESMSKKSPYWMDLILNVSPLVLQIFKVLTETHGDEIEDKLMRLLNNFSWFNKLSEDQKRRIIRAIIRSIKLILLFVNINFLND
jgi:hypothetical protein